MFSVSIFIYTGFIAVIVCVMAPIDIYSFFIFAAGNFVAKLNDMNISMKYEMYLFSLP